MGPTVEALLADDSELSTGGLNSRRQTAFQNGPAKNDGILHLPWNNAAQAFSDTLLFPIKLLRLRRTLRRSLRRRIDGAKIPFVIIRVHGRLDTRILLVHFPAEYFAGDFVFDFIQGQGLTAFHFVNHEAGWHGFHLGCAAGRKRKDLLILFGGKRPFSPAAEVGRHGLRFERQGGISLLLKDVLVFARGETLPTIAGY